MHFSRTIVLALTLALLASCASSHVLVGEQRPPISPDQVKVYLDPPPNYEKVALLESTSRGSFTVTSQQRTNKAIERMKHEAAKLGANGVLLQGVTGQSSGGVGYVDPGTGVGTFGGAIHKAGAGIAIFVPSE